MFDLVPLPIAISIGAILFCVPLEIIWPRIRRSQDWSGRIPAILLIACLSISTGWLLAHYGQDEIIAVLKSVQIFSLAKLPLPPLVIFVIGFLFVDFLAYAFHRLSHIIPPLWRVHAIHHADHHVTAITGHLHHPLEAVASYLFMMVFYVVLGIPIVVIALYISVNALHNIFSHADIALPRRIERFVRWVMITPDMHRTHHSVDLAEGNSNFGQVFPFWDRLFGTYFDRPAAGEENLKMGLANPSQLTKFDSLSLLNLPFRR